MSQHAYVLEPLSLGGLIDRTIQVYRDDVATLLTIALVGQAPMLLVSLLNVPVQQAVATQEFAPEAALAGIAMIPAVLVYLLLCYPLMIAATSYAVSERHLGRKVGAGPAFSYAWNRIMPLLITQTRVTLKVMLGVMLLLVPGIIWSLRYWLATTVATLEPIPAGRRWQGAGASMERSAALSQGMLLRIFAVLLIFGLFSGLVQLGAQLVTTLVLPEGSVITVLISSLVGIVLSPLGLGGTVLLYYDMRVRKEGFDLEHLARNISQPSPAQAQWPGAS